MWCFNDMESMRKLEEWGFNGNLDFGSWETIFYGEFDGQRNKKLLMGKEHRKKMSERENLFF